MSDLEIRELVDLPVIERTAVLAERDIDPWCAQAFRELGEDLSARGIRRVGPIALTLAAEVASSGRGVLRAVAPVPPEHAEALLPGRLVAVVRHEGSFRLVARALGAARATLAGGMPACGPGTTVVEDPEGEIRETYLVGPGSGLPPTTWVTEVALPVLRTG